MATHDYVIDNGTGAAVRTDLNNALAAIVSNNSSSSEPSTKYAYQWWADTTTGILKIRNSSNNGWVELFQLDGTLTLEDGSASTPGLAFRDDLNTGIFSSAADNFDIATGGSVRANVSSTGLNVTGTVVDDGATHDGDVTFTGASANIVFDKSDNALEFADNAEAKFGTGGDFKIYHDGSNSYLDENGTGNLRIRNVNGNAIELIAGTGETMLQANYNGGVDLYHDNVKKFETESGGVSLTGGAAANITALSDGATITIDMATACHHSVTLGGNRTFAAPSNQAVGQSGSIFITQDGTGSRTASFNSAFKFVGGTAPTLTTTAAAIDRIDYIVKASNVIQCAVSLDVK
tara:strand:- start:63 stop:1106 length:1044 start_codon:yes stop_codon:yes gene_type:complete